MPSQYICSNCGAPVSPAQNRCHECGAEIDWQKAVGRVSYVDYLPDARKRRRKRRGVVILGLLLTLILIFLAYQSWTSVWMQSQWRAWLGPAAYHSYQQGLQHLNGGQLGPARNDFDRMISLRGKQTSTPTPLSAPAPTPAILVTRQPSTTPTSAPSATIAIAPTVLPSPAPEESQAQALVLAAQKLKTENPCRAADLLQQALNLEDAVQIEDMRQEMLARCQQLTTAPPIDLPVTETATQPASQRIAYTAYDIASGLYSVRQWSLGDHLPSPDRIDWAMQPAFGPQRAIAFRSIRPDAPGIAVLQSDGSIRRITKGADDSWPRWGPGGEQIIFTSAQRSPDQSPHIYLVDIATRNIEDLGPGQHADWARTGQIVFSGCDAGTQNCGLWLLDPTTLQQTQITFVPDDSFPVWSPNGHYVVFMSSSRGQSWDIFILNIQTGFIIPTATHPAEDGLPVWSPDGRTIAFLSNRHSDWAVYLWKLNDLTTTRLFPVGPSLPNWQQAGLDWGP